MAKSKGPFAGWRDGKPPVLVEAEDNHAKAKAAFAKTPNDENRATYREATAILDGLRTEWRKMVRA